MNPLDPTLSLKHVAGTVVTIWCLVIAVVGPSIFHTKHRSKMRGEETIFICEPSYPPHFQRFLYTFFIEVIFVFIPMTLIAVFHICMWRKIENQPELESASEEVKRQHKMKRVSRTFQIIFFMYFMMTVPHALCVLVVMYYKDYDQLFFERHYDQLVRWNDGTLSILILNSCVNAFIYGKAHSKLWKFCTYPRVRVQRRDNIQM